MIIHNKKFLEKCIKKIILRNGYTPSIAEITRELNEAGYKISKPTTWKAIKKLKEKNKKFIELLKPQHSS